MRSSWRMSRTTRVIVSVAVLASALAGASIHPGAAAGAEGKVSTIEPWARVNGMLVVVGTARRAEVALFGTWCDPVVLIAGRRARACGHVPRVERLFVGHGWFAPAPSIEREWRQLRWEMWIDGQRVDLDKFGTSDRWLVRFPPARGKDVILREWSVTLLRAPSGRHTIRYRTSWPGGTTDTTWTFTVRRR
jgi:hypothetical protein